MEEYRRKKIYIDRVFQRKFLFLFLTLTVTASAANILFLFLYLKKDVEDNLYRSRIIISNVNEVIAGNVLLFNTAVLLLMIVFSIIFYFVIKQRVRSFVDTLKDALSRSRDGSINLDQNPHEFPEEFSEANSILTDFFQFIDRKLQMEKQAGQLLDSFVNNPCGETKKAALERIRGVLNCCHH